MGLPGFLLGLTASTCAASSHSKSDRSGGSGRGWEGRNECEKLPHTCGATDLPRVANQDWPPSEIDAFVKRAELGTVVIERANGRNRLRAECKVPGAYVSYPGKQGVGRLWGTNRPLLHP